MARSPPASSLSDLPELVEIVRQYAAPLAPAARPAFYEAIDKALGGACVLGAGAVARVCREVQRRFVAIPDGKPVVDGRR
jgi:hypothetical protein